MFQIKVADVVINVYGAYTRLRDNSKAAMMAAIEIYNKPSFVYRDECCVILLVNAWELILKGLLSKHRVRIYYRKIRNEDYRTFSLQDSLRVAEPYFPSEVDYSSVKYNLDHLVDYRNKAIHFYNIQGIPPVIYNLAQACIKNYCDLLRYSFGVDLPNEVNIVLLPLSIGRMPLDPIQFIDENSYSGKYSNEVSNFLKSIGAAVTDLEDNNGDISRLLVTFSIRYESVKKSKDAVAVVGIDNNAPNTVAIRKFEPNCFLRQKEILEKLPSDIGGTKINQYTFQAFIWKNKIREKKHLYWSDKSGAVTRYSPEIISMIKNTPGEELQKARDVYSQNRASPSRS